MLQTKGMHGASTARKQQGTGTLPPCCFALCGPNHRLATSVSCLGATPALNLLLSCSKQLFGRNLLRPQDCVLLCLLQPLGKGQLLCMKVEAIESVMEDEMFQFSAADPEKRKVYDAYGEEGLKAGAPPPVSTLACTCTCVLHLLS